MKESKVPKRQYTQEYKLESARLAQSAGINEAARRLGIPSATVGNWKRPLGKNTGGADDFLDGRRRCYDNIFVERLWRSVKYECIDLNAFENGRELRKALADYFDWYNKERPHKALGQRSPDDVYFGGGQNFLVA